MSASLATDYPVSEQISSETFIYNFIKSLPKQSFRLDYLDPKSEAFDPDLLDELENEFAVNYDCIVPETHGLKSDGLLLAKNIIVSLITLK